LLQYEMVIAADVCCFSILFAKSITMQLLCVGFVLIVFLYPPLGDINRKALSVLLSRFCLIAYYIY